MLLELYRIVEALMAVYYANLIVPRFTKTWFPLEMSLELFIFDFDSSKKSQFRIIYPFVSDAVIAAELSMVELWRIKEVIRMSYEDVDALLCRTIRLDSLMILTSCNARLFSEIFPDNAVNSSTLQYSRIVFLIKKFYKWSPEEIENSTVLLKYESFMSM